MLDYREKRLQMEPLKFSSASPSAEELDSLEFRKAVCKGVYDDKKSIFVGPRSRSISGVTENGYYLITPLMPAPSCPDSVSFPVIVNRGWVPRSWRDKFVEASQDGEQSSERLPSPSQAGGTKSWWRFWSRKPDITEDHSPPVTPVEVIGVVRESEKPSIFVPANDPESSQWFYVDVPGIARACGLPENTIYLEDINENINPSNPYPIPKDVNTLIRSSVMPRDHLNYTMTWYSLSAAVTFMAFKRLRQKNKRR
ncbi:surfeit locus protein 1-like [Neltuma alba]|uniref:surfeit locus protein 1-like n=1 Tax=Neltuma alba TaxID=207710 RepID=UPI0010A443E5|nr:surfeit locus protein 1-like [Prosopis alba]XP_028805470.1 surfeit locus protein 1-like [Prosopis alba]